MSIEPGNYEPKAVVKKRIPSLNLRPGAMPNHSICLIIEVYEHWYLIGTVSGSLRKVLFLTFKIVFCVLKWLVRKS